MEINEKLPYMDTFPLPSPSHRMLLLQANSLRMARQAKQHHNAINGSHEELRKPFLTEHSYI